MATTQKSSFWSVTINNPTPADEENINVARQKGWKVTGQLERGEEGTLHYQLAIRTNQIRFSAMKKAFPRAHIEVAKNARALETYVHKAETREGPLLEQDDLYPSLSQLWDLIYQQLAEKRIVDTQVLYETHRYIRGFDDDTYEAGLALWHSLNTIPLDAFDQIIRILITKGYHVESMASNPQNRFAWRYYHEQLMARACWREKNLVTRHNNALQENDSSESIQTAEIPTITESESP